MRCQSLWATAGESGAHSALIMAKLHLLTGPLPPAMQYGASRKGSRRWRILGSVGMRRAQIDIAMDVSLLPFLFRNLADLCVSSLRDEPLRYPCFLIITALCRSGDGCTTSSVIYVSNSETRVQ